MERNLVEAFLTCLFPTTSGSLSTLNPFELARFEIVATIFQLAKNPFAGHSVFQLANGLLDPVIPNHHL